MSRFDGLCESDKAYLIAYWRTIDRMEAYENLLAQEEMSSAAKAK